jgi:hypothetical protein
LYALNTANLGKYNARDSQIVQKVHPTTEFPGWARVLAALRRERRTA